MEINEKEAATIRDEMHNLDIGIISNFKTYYDKLYYIIASGEGFSSKVYEDSRKILTIGYGFNMQRGSKSREEWEEAFGDIPSFDQALKGEITITKEQARKLKRYGVEIREKELKGAYYPYWEKIRLNERAVITDLYYQTPKLAKKGTKLQKSIMNYYRTSDPKFLADALYEIKYNSSHSKNPGERIGLQRRNDIRAVIFDSRECELYSRPNDELVPKAKRIKVIPGKTVISRDVSNHFPESTDASNYYIWRTVGDDKVRSSHRELEGKVFHDEEDMVHPGEGRGCRCYKQKLPINAVVIEEDDDLYVENSIVRKYYASLDEIPNFCIK